MRLSLFAIALLVSSCGSTPNTRGVHAPDNQNDLTVGELKPRLEKALGSPNRGGPRLYGIQQRENDIHIQFTINTDKTIEKISYGAKSDVADILKVIHRSGIGYAEVNVIGIYFLEDDFGNLNKSEVVDATYSRQAIDRLNWENFNVENVYRVADSFTSHLSFR